MDFFKVKKKFRKPHKPIPEDDSDVNSPLPEPEDSKKVTFTANEANGGQPRGAGAGGEIEVDDEEDEDDFITNEVKRRLKELRRNSFMVLIPEEESCAEEEEDEDEAIAEEGTDHPAGWRDVEAEARQWWGGFDALYDKYCERMLFFDRLLTRHLNESDCQSPVATPSPRSAAKKLSSPLSCLYMKKFEEPEEDEIEHLHQPQIDSYQDIETAYVAHICLTWEALHSQYTQLTKKFFYWPENRTCYNHSAQLLQQFQVLLQRYIENEPFEQGPRAEVYARARKLWPMLLQVPNIKASDLMETGREESSSTVLAPYLIEIMESSIVTFHHFLKNDKKKSSGARSRSGNQPSAQLHQIQSSLDKKLVKLKELRKKSRGWKKISWPQVQDDVQVLFGLIDIKVLSRVLRMATITSEQLLWCEEKMKKLDIVDGKLRRDTSPIIFPC